MKILVPVKRVIDYNVQVRVKADQSGIDDAHVKMSINPFDEIAVEEAVRLKEAGVADEVVVISVGVKKCEEIIRVAQAMGADRGYLIQTDDYIEPLNVAKVIQKIAEQEQPDLILMGKQAIDDDANQTGQMLSALLGWSLATFASEIETGNSTVKVTREVDAGHQVLELNLPAVVTADLRLNEPRYPTLPNIMKAKRKPMETRQIGELDIDIAPRLKVLKTAAPKQREAGVIVGSVSELVDKLRHEANLQW